LWQGKKLVEPESYTGRSCPFPRNTLALVRVGAMTIKLWGSTVIWYDENP